MQKSAYQTTKFLDVPIFSSSYDSLLNFLQAHLKREKSLLTLVTPNPEQIVLSRSDYNFKHHLQSADLALPDGIGIVLASKVLKLLKGTPAVSERIAGVDVVASLLKEAKTEGYSLLVIGGRKYGAEQSVSRELASLGVSQLAVTPVHKEWYWTEGFVDVSQPTSKEEENLATILKLLKPKIVFIALGAPHQEAWLISHRSLLEKSNVSVAMVVGGAFDILLDKIPRAPAFLRSVGLEWLFRLGQEPWRWKRQLKLLHFLKLIVQEL